MITDHRDRLGTSALCQALGESRSSWYRTSRKERPTSDRTRSPQRHAPRKLQKEERENILALLHSERFIDVAPGEVYAILLDEGQYLCSERTMYRILASENENGNRRQHAPRQYARPELIATAPNQVWSWDITKLKGPRTWTYYYLYKIMDIFSRYVVGWLVADREAAYLAEDLIADSCLKQEIEAEQLTIHADRGSSMTAKTVGQLLVDLGVTKSHSRPYVSNDNPFSESAFKTLKYRPDFPGRFCVREEARSYCQQFFTWYNTVHRHSGICMLTPESVHYSRHEEVLIARQKILEAAYAAHPERFVRGVPRVQNLANAVYINPPKSSPSNSLKTN